MQISSSWEKDLYSFALLEVLFGFFPVKGVFFSELRVKDRVDLPDLIVGAIAIKVPSWHFLDLHSGSNTVENEGVVW